MFILIKKLLIIFSVFNLFNFKIKVSYKVILRLKTNVFLLVFVTGIVKIILNIVFTVLN